MKEIIQSYSQSVDETHVQIGEVHNEFVRNMENTSVEGLVQKLAESKGTGKERPGPIEFEECNAAIATEGAKPRKRKTFAIPGRRKDKDTDSMESTEVEAANTANGAPPGYYGAIDIQNANSFYSSSDSDDDDKPMKFRVEIKPVQPNNAVPQNRATIDELKVSIENIILLPSTSGQMRRNQSRVSRLSSLSSKTKVQGGDVLSKNKTATSYNDKLTNNDLLSLDPFSPTLAGSSSSVSSSAVEPVLQHSPPPPLTESRPKEACSSSFSSSPTSSLGSPENPFEPGPKPPVARARSAPITSQPSGELLPPLLPLLLDPATGATGSDPWDDDERRWIAFSDGCQSGPPEGPQQCGGAGRPKRCLSESAADDPSNGKQDAAGTDNGSEKNLGPVLTGRVPALNRPTTPLTAGALVPPPRPSSRPKLPTGKLTGINEIVRPFSPPKMTSASPPPPAPLARAESSSSLSSNASMSASNTPTVGPEPIYPLALSSLEPEQFLPPLPAFQKDDDFIAKLPTYEKRCETPAGTSRGPSPVTLASQDALPIAVAFTESVNAYFKGADPTKCIVKITGDMTLSFPMGIIKVFTSNPSPAVLTFKLKNTSKLEQILPNQQLLYSDPPPSDSDSRDFWFNMQALMSYLRKAAEQNPTASYYNVDILKYQVHSSGIQSTPLNLAVYWKCLPSTTDLCLDYRFNPEPMSGPGSLANVQILVPVDGGVSSMQALPSGIWNAEQNKFLWKLSDISDKSDNEGAGSLRAKFELSSGPSTPATLAVQFMNEGSTLSGVDMELQGTGYRLSLSKKRFATGMYGSTACSFSMRPP
ncbi:F-BAR domain only protein 2 [Merluccius polli]|uniref:F-BAR domain only protein 2 n=1 Tax=Merluccius polli TaxID=89951 RepID=A0AA47MFY5_MERPO|nr:F-BAR domain only protein 2 [Merluccius polli]